MHRNSGISADGAQAAHRIYRARDIPGMGDWKKFAASFKAHPYAEVFPMIDEGSGEFGALVRSLEARGMLDPVILDRDLQVVDGRNRLRAALRVSQDEDSGFGEPIFQFYDELDIDFDEWYLEDYVMAKNVERRHLSADQLAMCFAKFYEDKDWVNEVRKKTNLNLVPNARLVSRASQMVSPRKPGRNRDANKQSTTAATVASKAGVSQRKAQQALKVAKDAPELVEDVQTGKVSLKDAEKAAKVKAPPKQRAKRAKVRASKPAEKLLETMSASMADLRAARSGPQHRFKSALLAADYLHGLLPEMPRKERDSIVARISAADRMQPGAGPAAAEPTVEVLVAAGAATRTNEPTADPEALLAAEIEALPAGPKARMVKLARSMLALVDMLVDREVARRMPEELRARVPLVIAELEQARAERDEARRHEATALSNPNNWLTVEQHRTLLSFFASDRKPEAERDRWDKAMQIVNRMQPVPKARGKKPAMPGDAAAQRAMPSFADLSIAKARAEIDAAIAKLAEEARAEEADKPVAKVAPKPKTKAKAKRRLGYEIAEQLVSMFGGRAA